MAFETLVMRAPSAMTAPEPGTPSIPDLTKDLYAEWHYDDFASSGSHWPARVGSFDLTVPSGFAAPTRQPASLNGRGALSFDYNDSTTSPFRALSLEGGGGFLLDAPVTIGVVVYNRSYKSAGGNPTSRIIASRDSTQAYIIGNSNSEHAGFNVMVGSSIKASSAPADDSLDNSWHVVVATITDEETRLYIDGLPAIIGGGAAGVSSTGLRVGVNASGANPFTGFMRGMTFHKRAMNENDARGLSDYLRWIHLEGGA